MIRTVICVPRWPDGGRRDEVWAWLKPWIAQQFPDYPIVEGHAPDPGEARAKAAHAAGDWELGLFWDADTLVHPDAVEAALDRASQSLQMVLACDSHMYCSKDSSDRILRGDRHWFPRPYTVTQETIWQAMYRVPCSGVWAVSRQLYDLCGGYPTFCEGWGYEDLIWFQMTSIFGKEGVTWTEGHIQLHLWHPPAQRTLERHANHPTALRNKMLWQQLAHVRPYDDARIKARALLAPYGHLAP